MCLEHNVSVFILINEYIFVTIYKNANILTYNTTMYKFVHDYRSQGFIFNFSVGGEMALEAFATS